MKAVSGGYFLKINSFLFFISSQNQQWHKKLFCFCAYVMGGRSRMDASGLQSWVSGSMYGNENSKKWDKSMKLLTTKLSILSETVLITQNKVQKPKLDLDRLKT
jgi:hypothetical protein